MDLHLVLDDLLTLRQTPNSIRWQKSVAYVSYLLRYIKHGLNNLK